MLLGQSRGARRSDEWERHSILERSHLSNHFHDGLHEGRAHSSDDLPENQICHDDLRALVRRKIPWNRGDQCVDPYDENEVYPFTWRARIYLLRHEGLASQFLAWL